MHHMTPRRIVVIGQRLINQHKLRILDLWRTRGFGRSSMAAMAKKGKEREKERHVLARTGQQDDRVMGRER